MLNTYQVSGNYRQEMTQLGQEFQDYIVDRAWEHGIIVAQYVSKKYQYAHGESRTKVEIKLDRKAVETKNLYIEIAEKADESKPNYSPAGIYAGHCKTYIIGDYQKAYVLSIPALQLLHKYGNFREVTTATSIGFLLPIHEAAKWADAVII